MRGGWVERGTVAVRLGRPHFAFFRGYLDGLEIGALASRYLAPLLPDTGRHDPSRSRDGDHVDLRLARSMVRWIRAQLQVAARRSLGPADARLLAVAPAALLPAPPARLPSLEQFRDEQDPDGLFSERELIDLFSQMHAPSGADAQPARRAARNQRLRLRQQRALARLEQLVGADPQLADPIDAWLDATLAARLAAIGIITLSQLLDLIDRHGYRWYCKVPKIGLKAACHISGWLQQESVRVALGRGVPEHALTPTRSHPRVNPGLAALNAPPARALLAVLTQLEHQPALNGAQGSNRGGRCQLDANDDWSAIQAWLAARDLADHSARAYRKESERFLLWAVHECGKPVSSLTVEDCSRYRLFLAQLGHCPDADWTALFRLPQDAWIGPRGVLRQSQYWRPFHGPMRAASQQQAIVIIQSLLQWLQEQRYLHANPMPRARRRRTCVAGSPPSRALSIDEWRLAREQVPKAHAVIEAPAHGASIHPDLLPGAEAHGLTHRDGLNEAGARLRFIVSLAYGTGLRLSEMCQLRRRHLVSFQCRDDTPSGWLLNVEGKGGVLREIPLARPVMADLEAYLAIRGLDLQSAAPEAALIAALMPVSRTISGVAVDRPLSSQRIYCLIKRLFADVAEHVSPPAQAERLRQASPHWLRHTFATHALAHEMPLEILRDLLGHRSLETTSRYVSTERERRSQAIEKFATAAQ